MERGRFSERMGYVKVPIQLESIDGPLRNSIWNLVSSLVIREFIYEAAKAIATDVLRVPTEYVPGQGTRLWLLQQCQKQLDWSQCYDLLEYVVDHAGKFSGRKVNPDVAQQMANGMLEREHSGYRFVGGQLTRISEPVEIEEVERTLTQAASLGLEGVHAHISQALNLFGKRPEPDHRNAIKEAISAVEGAVKLIEGRRGGDLKDALEALSKRLTIHPSLRDGLLKLYGFTSDEDGIRHPILDEPNIGEEDARFMIVACSAVVNWLIVKAEAAGLLKPQGK